MRWAFGVILLASVLVAAAPRKGSVHATSGTADFERTFVGSVGNLSVAPSAADIVVLHYPHYSNQDSFTVKSGDVMTWEGVDIYGFKVIRTNATAVDVYWW